MELANVVVMFFNWIYILSDLIQELIMKEGRGGGRSAKRLRT